MTAEDDSRRLKFNAMVTFDELWPAMPLGPPTYDLREVVTDLMAAFVTRTVDHRAYVDAEIARLNIENERLRADKERLRDELMEYNAEIERLRAEKLDLYKAHEEKDDVIKRFERLQRETLGPVIAENEILRAALRQYKTAYGALEDASDE